MILLFALLATPPEPMPFSRMIDDDYPAAALKRSEEGRTRFRLDVNERGRPENCQVVESSGSADLDQAACKLFLRNARFKPARDDAGKPVRGSFEGSMNWRLPR